MPSIVSIIGISKSGKTTLVEKLVLELTTRGYRVATIKHAREVTFDLEGKDSWRHIQAGSAATALSSPDEVIIIKPFQKEPTLEQVARFFGEDYDIILAEGFKGGSAPKIEAHLKQAGAPLQSVKKLVAMVTDEPLETKARQYSFNDIKNLVDLLENGFIKPQTERTSLYINEVPVTLKSFPKTIIRTTLIGMLSALKGTGQVKSIDIHLRK